MTLFGRTSQAAYTVDDSYNDRRITVTKNLDRSAVRARDAAVAMRSDDLAALLQLEGLVDSCRASLAASSGPEAAATGCGIQCHADDAGFAGVIAASLPDACVPRRHSMLLTPTNSLGDALPSTPQALGDQREDDSRLRAVMGIDPSASPDNGVSPHVAIVAARSASQC